MLPWPVFWGLLSRLLASTHVPDCIRAWCCYNTNAQVQSQEREERKTQLVGVLGGRDDGVLMQYARAQEKRDAMRRHQNEMLPQPTPKTLPLKMMLRLLPLPVLLRMRMLPRLVLVLRLLRLLLLLL